MFTRLKELAYALAIRLVFVMGIGMVVARCVFGVDRYGRNPSTTKDYVVWVAITLILSFIAWVVYKFAEDMGGMGSSKPQTARDQEYNNIQAGYRVAASKGKTTLQPGYKRQEDEYRKKYGTTARTGGTK